MGMCDYGSCRQSKKFFSNGCGYHTCDTKRCGNIVANSNTVKCRKHNICMYENCSNHSTESNLCQIHTCTKYNCDNSVEKDKTLCTTHMIESKK